VFIPHGLFDFPFERMRTRSPYQVIELGLPYHMLREVLKQIEHALETPLQGFGDLSVEAIMQVTGLPHADAILAKPFSLEDLRNEVKRLFGDEA